MKKILAVLLALVMVLSLAACSASAEKDTSSNETNETQSGTNDTQSQTDETLKVAFLYDSPVGDGGWITSHELGQQAVAAMPGVETTFADNVPESDGWTYMNNFAKEGCDIVFACSFGYMNDCADVAVKNPDTIFMHCSGYMTEDNMGNYFGRNYEGAYLCGMACGAVTKSNILGYVAPYPIAEVIRNINAFALGAKAVNPDAVVQVVWISSWYDPALASEAAETLIANGADALFGYENSPAVSQTAAKHQVYACGQHSDSSSYAPDYVLTSSLWNWGTVYTYVVDQVKNGTWTNDAIWWGMKEGVVDIAELNPVIPEEAQTMIRDIRDRLVAGDETANPFYGEVVDQAGTVRLADGVDASFDDLMNMDYFVSNVVGDIS